MLKTYPGSCHCGKVRFEADIDLSAGTGKCNCSICTKQRNWGTSIKPEAFRLLAGESAVSEYTFGSHSVHHTFCKHCGIRVFGRGYVEEIGGHFLFDQSRSPGQCHAGRTDRRAGAVLRWAQQSVGAYAGGNAASVKGVAASKDFDSGREERWGLMRSARYGVRLNRWKSFESAMGLT